MRTLTKLTFALVLFVIVPRVANACGCSRISTVLDDFEHADLVVIARVKSFTKTTERNLQGNYITHATMVIEKVFKGDVKTGEELTFAQGDPVLGCSWSFYDDYVNEKYLLYLYRPEKPSDPFFISTCNRSNSVENAGDDLLYLNNIDKVRGRTRVSGVIEVEGGDEEGLQLRIRGKNKSYFATTDKNGVYELYDLPPGHYSLEPILRFGWKVEDYHLTRQQTRAEWRRSNLDPPPPPPKKVWFTLRPKRHFGVNIRFRLSNRIAGRVTAPDGRPMQWVCVSLVNTSDAMPLVCNDLSEADGSFAIDSVAAGSYYLIFNSENIRSSRQPFPKLYYPGVANPDSAKVLTVKFGESIGNLDFVPRTMYETVKVEGVVRYANGRPASDRRVVFNSPKTNDVDGSTDTMTDKHGRFSLTVLKGLRGEVSAWYAPERREFDTCARLKKLLERSGENTRWFQTQRVTVEADANKTLELRFDVSQCR